MADKTLTTASRKSGLLMMAEGENSACLSNARSIPYSEIYSQRTGMMETPVERLQRAAEDETKRAARSQ